MNRYPLLSPVLALAPSGDPQPAVQPAPPATTPATVDAQPVANLREVATVVREDVLPALSTGQMILSLLGAGIGAFHGARRNHGSVVWGLVWGTAGAAAPVITTGIAAAQGIGRPKGKG